MASLDWSQCPAVERIPGKVGGAWVFKNTRTPVSIVFENLQDGMTIDELMKQYPLTREQIIAALSLRRLGWKTARCPRQQRGTRSRALADVDTRVGSQTVKFRQAT